MPLKTHLDEQPTLNLTAMLDVMFLLIIFFMLNTQFLPTTSGRSTCRCPQVVDRGHPGRRRRAEDRQRLSRRHDHARRGRQ